MDVLDALSGMGRDVLTIMITAYATFETAVKATKLGAYDFLAKPFTPDELRYAVRKATSQLILSRQARKLAEEKRQVRFNFISVLAHELKAPLNAVEGYLNILATTEADQNLAMVERSIVRVDGMKKLISDLLDLTRIESGQRERVDPQARPARAGPRLDRALRRRRRATRRHGRRSTRPATSSCWPTPARSRSSSTTSSRTRSSTTATAAAWTSSCARLDGRRRDRRRRHRHRPQARGGGQALPRVHAHQERAHGQGPRQRPGSLDGAQDRDHVRGRRQASRASRRRQHVHRDAQGRGRGGPGRRSRRPAAGPERPATPERTPASAPAAACTRGPDTGESSLIEAVLHRGIRGSTGRDRTLSSPAGAGAVGTPHHEPSRHGRRKGRRAARRAMG